MRNRGIAENTSPGSKTMKRTIVVAALFLALAQIPAIGQNYTPRLVLDEGQSAPIHKVVFVDPRIKKLLPHAIKATGLNCTRNSDCQSQCCCHAALSATCEDADTCRRELGGDCR